LTTSELVDEWDEQFTLTPAGEAWVESYMARDVTLTFVGTPNNKRMTLNIRGLAT
jgi:hypothetical protein